MPLPLGDKWGKRRRQRQRENLEGAGGGRKWIGRRRGHGGEVGDQEQESGGRANTLTTHSGSKNALGGCWKLALLSATGEAPLGGSPASNSGGIVAQIAWGAPWCPPLPP